MPYFVVEYSMVTSLRKDSRNEEVYGAKSINDLILLSIYAVTNGGKKCTFENLIEKCYTLFPKTFGFQQHPEWPDARKLDRPLRDLRNKSLIGGDPKTFFSLTKNGKKRSEDIALIVKQKRLFP